MEPAGKGENAVGGRRSSGGWAVRLASDASTYLDSPQPNSADNSAAASPAAQMPGQRAPKRAGGGRGRSRRARRRVGAGPSMEMRAMLLEPGMVMRVSTMACASGGVCLILALFSGPVLVFLAVLVLGICGMCYSIRQRGALEYLPRGVVDLLTRTTLLEWLTDTSVFDAVKNYLVFMMGLSPEETQVVLSSLPEEMQETLTRPGLMHTLPQPLQALLLPSNHSTLAGPARAGSTVAAGAGDGREGAGRWRRLRVAAEAAASSERLRGDGGEAGRAALGNDDDHRPRPEHEELEEPLGRLVWNPLPVPPAHETRLPLGGYDGGNVEQAGRQRRSRHGEWTQRRQQLRYGYAEELGGERSDEEQFSDSGGVGDASGDDEGDGAGAGARDGDGDDSAARDDALRSGKEGVDYSEVGDDGENRDGGDNDADDDASDDGDGDGDGDDDDSEGEDGRDDRGDSGDSAIGNCNRERVGGPGAARGGLGGVFRRRPVRAAAEPRRCTPWNVSPSRSRSLSAGGAVVGGARGRASTEGVEADRGRKSQSPWRLSSAALAEGAGGSASGRRAVGGRAGIAPSGGFVPSAERIVASILQRRVDSAVKAAWGVVDERGIRRAALGSGIALAAHVALSERARRQAGSMLRGSLLAALAGTATVCAGLAYLKPGEAAADVAPSNAAEVAPSAAARNEDDGSGGSSSSARRQGAGVGQGGRSSRLTSYRAGLRRWLRARTPSARSMIGLLGMICVLLAVRKWQVLRRAAIRAAMPRRMYGAPLP